MPRRSVLDESAVELILTSQATHRVLAQQLGVHRSTISQVRLGHICSHVLPDLPRWQPNVNCGHCLHWDDGCTLDFPDPKVEGLHFARDCACFSHRR